MTLAYDIGLARLPLGVEGIEFLLEPLVGRCAGVDRAAYGESGARVISPGHGPLRSNANVPPFPHRAIGAKDQQARDERQCRCVAKFSAAMRRTPGPRHLLAFRLHLSRDLRSHCNSYRHLCARRANRIKVPGDRARRRSCSAIGNIGVRHGYFSVG
jgi:hypothetical protein